MIVSTAEPCDATPSKVAPRKATSGGSVTHITSEILTKVMDSVAYLIWSATAGGLVEYGNSTWGSLISTGSDMPVEQVLLPRLHPEDRERWRERWREALRSGQPYEIEYRLQWQSQTSERWLLERGTPVRDPRSGALVRWIVAVTPIDRYKRQEEELRTRLHQQSDFLATVLHELRNPLTPIAGAIEQLRHKPGDVVNVTAARGVMQRQLRQLTCLVDDLLEISRFSRGGIRLHRERMDLREVIETAVEAAGPLIEVRQQKLTLGSGDRPIYLFADPVRLTQVMTNLLMNAAKYTHRGGHISVITAEKEGVVSIRVRDDGVGIAAETLPHVFDLFVQGHSDSHSASKGLGVGLAVARRLVELHDGTISVRSEGPGRGSEFIVILPGAYRPIGMAN